MPMNKYSSDPSGDKPEVLPDEEADARLKRAKARAENSDEITEAREGAEGPDDEVRALAQRNRRIRNQAIEQDKQALEDAPEPKKDGGDTSEHWGP